MYRSAPPAPRTIDGRLYSQPAVFQASGVQLFPPFVHRTCVFVKSDGSTSSGLVQVLPPDHATRTTDANAAAYARSRSCFDEFARHIGPRSVHSVDGWGEAPDRSTMRRVFDALWAAHTDEHECSRVREEDLDGRYFSLLQRAVSDMRFEGVVPSKGRGDTSRHSPETRAFYRDKWDREDNVERASTLVQFFAPFCHFYAQPIWGVSKSVAADIVADLCASYDLPIDSWGQQRDWKSYFLDLFFRQWPRQLSADPCAHADVASVHPGTNQYGQWDDHAQTYTYGNDEDNERARLARSHDRVRAKLDALERDRYAVRDDPWSTQAPRASAVRATPRVQEDPRRREDLRAQMHDWGVSETLMARMDRMDLDSAERAWNAYMSRANGGGRRSGRARAGTVAPLVFASLVLSAAASCK